MNEQIKPQIRPIGVANFANSPAIGHHLRLDVTNLRFTLPRPELIELPLNDYDTKSVNNCDGF